ncbi:hypothetical protein CEXT_94431 [Caerostris extrusa]|uniref:Uncharacterized protein n=1 Tax=Caerostris extrusa TaxID=172846 RepID=A0AAV4XZ12_CAEEX|nr:hypothetical protein CEXT_94431 [Caerostris extrusa]
MPIENARWPETPMRDAASAFDPAPVIAAYRFPGVTAQAWHRDVLEYIMNESSPVHRLPKSSSGSAILDFCECTHFWGMMGLKNSNNLCFS